MNYVFLDIETSGLDYKNDEILFINCIKTDAYFKILGKIKLDIKTKSAISNNEMLVRKLTLKDAMIDLKNFVSKSFVITYNAKNNLSFLINAMYETKVDMSFWYLDLKILLREKTFYEMKYNELCRLYKIKRSEKVVEYMGIAKTYMASNNIKDLAEFTSVKPRKWNCIFRGINYPEYLGDTGKYSYYMADLSKDKYTSYLFCLKELRLEDFTFEELILLKEKYDIKILMNILDVNEETLKITKDYYIMSYGGKIDPNTKWGAEYINKLNEAARFILTHGDDVEITCYDTIEELDEKFKLTDKKIMNIIKPKIVREKKKWSRWS